MGGEEVLLRGGEEEEEGVLVEHCGRIDGLCLVQVRGYMSFSPFSGVSLMPSLRCLPQSTQKTTSTFGCSHGATRLDAHVRIR